MRASLTLAAAPLLMVLLALVPAGGIAVQAQETAVERGNDEPDEADKPNEALRWRRGMPESDASDDADETPPITGVAVSHDPFYAYDEGLSLPPLPGGKDVVICMAGCDGPRGGVVYKKPQ